MILDANISQVMLRNIPNKVDQAMLKAIIDESSRGQYDFMYLRIDFSNNCKLVPSSIVQVILLTLLKRWLRVHQLR